MTVVARSSLACPAPCTGKCEFELRIEGTWDPTLCGGAGGYKDAKVLTLKKSPPAADGHTCTADLDREPSPGAGFINWELCNGTKCELTSKNFPDGNPIPYDPNNLPAGGLPPGKEAINPECYASFTSGGTPTGGGGQTFPAVKSLSVDFDIVTICECGGAENRGTMGLQGSLPTPVQTPETPEPETPEKRPWWKRLWDWFWGLF